jgi:hypothetical protein
MVRLSNPSFKQEDHAMGIPKDKLNRIFQQLPPNYQDNVLDYMEFLLQKVTKDQWDNIQEIDEPLSEEEKQSIEDDSGYLSSKEAKSEFRLQIDLP